MPQTAFVFLVGCAAISALPPLNGFVSEWLTFQAILLSPQLPSWGLKLLIPAVGALLAVCIAYGYQRSRFGRVLRATREDPAAARAVGVSMYVQRLVAFGLSGALAGFAGGIYVHLLPLNTEALYLNLTFITLAMLVIGGTTSLLGAVVGALAVSGVDSFLANAENGVSLAGWNVDLPSGTRIVVVGALMALVLILRPSGLTGGRELGLPRRPRIGSAP